MTKICRFLPHFRAYIKIRHDISGRNFFFQRFLIRSIKKNQGDIFWEFDFEQTCEKSKKILLVLFLKKFTIMA